MFFSRIKFIREQNNYKQYDIASKLNVNPSNYSRWENGKETIPLIKLNDFCNIFNIKIDYIVGFIQEPSFKRKNKINKKKIGYKLKKIRKKEKITQQELAELLNTTQSTISAYESGKTTILTSYAYIICQKYNISMDWFCGK